eukprot:Ihof_evm8s165 gene=Ihof_evmTU8s165
MVVAIERNTYRPSILEVVLKETIDAYLTFYLRTFFSDIQILGHENVPLYGPCIVVANHNNQFMDAALLGASIDECGRQAQFLIAQKSYDRPMVGAIAKAIRSIPIARVIDNLKPGIGTVSITKGSTTLYGQATLFTKDFAPGDSIKITHDVYRVMQVKSDTELELADVSLEDATEVTGWKFAKKIVQNTIYEKVHELFRHGGCLAVFPEGGSHDNTKMLPLKPGVAIMALGAMANDSKLHVPIIPCGLNYYGDGHKFRSRVVVTFGHPIDIEDSIVEQYKEGSRANKFGATAKVMERVQGEMENLLITTASYEDLLIIHTLRRLYLPVTRRITRMEYHNLNRHMSKLLAAKRDSEEMVAFFNELLEYREDLRDEWLSDRQIVRFIQEQKHPRQETLLELVERCVKLVFMASLVAPGAVLALPAVVAVNRYASKKMTEAKLASDVKLKGFDVVASWKVLTMMVVSPSLIICYASIFGLILYFYLHCSVMETLVGILFFIIFEAVYLMWCINVVDDIVRMARTIQPLYYQVRGTKKAIDWLKRRQELATK